MPVLIALVLLVLAVVLPRTTLAQNHSVLVIGRTFRLIGVGLGAGFVAGMVAGLGSRLVMRIVALMGRSHYGDVTHHNAVVGLTTVGGTMNLVFEGAFMGVAASLFYLVVRPWLPGRPLVRGMLYGLLVLLVFGAVVLDGDYEYFRFVSPAISVSLFALLFPLYGVVLALLIEWWGRASSGFTGWPMRIGRVVLSAIAVLAAVQLLRHLRLEYQLFT